jgi:hypothetical protein
MWYLCCGVIPDENNDILSSELPVSSFAYMEATDV